MQKITTFLTCDDQAEQAARFYVSIFGDQRRVVGTLKGSDAKAMMQRKKLDLAKLQRAFDRR